MLSRTYRKLEKIHGTAFFPITYKAVKIASNVWYPLKDRLKRKNTHNWEKSNIIVSMTSFPARINKVYLTVYSILNQTVKPEKIILYLSKEQFKGREALPDTLRKLEKSDLFAIEFVDGDIRSHKKYYYTVKDYPDSPVLTIDDDIFYPEDLIEVLLKTSLKYPGAVCCTHAHRIIEHKGVFAPYSKWDQETQIVESARADLVPIGCGGVLYPAGCFKGTEVLDMVKMMEICPLADDLWLKCHSLINGHKAVKSGHYLHWVFSDLIIVHNKTLTSENLGNNKNDIQFNKLLETFPVFRGCLTSD